MNEGKQLARKGAADMKLQNRFAALTASLALLAFATATAQAQNLEWTFEAQTLDKDSWNISRVESLVKTGDEFSFVSGKDCMLHFEIEPFMAKDFSVMEIELSSDRKDGGQVFFSAAGKPLSEAASCRYEVKASPEPQKIYVVLSQNPLWTGKVSQLRLDPVNSEGVAVKLMSVKLLSPGSLFWKLSNAESGFWTSGAWAFLSGKDVMLTNSGKTDFKGRVHQDPGNRNARVQGRNSPILLRRRRQALQRGGRQLQVAARPPGSELKTYKIDLTTNPIGRGLIASSGSTPWSEAASNLDQGHKASGRLASLRFAIENASVLASRFRVQRFRRQEA
jgi:hypothetical protein